MKKSAEEKKVDSEELHLWMKELWDKMPKGTKKCKSCLGPIFGDYKPIYMDHGLEKSKYPQYAMVEANVNIICSDCHWKKTSGFLTDRYRKLIENLLSLHYKNELI